MYLLIIKIILFVIELTSQSRVLLRVPYSYTVLNTRMIISVKEINGIDLVMGTVNIACGLETRFINISC